METLTQALANAILPIAITSLVGVIGWTLSKMVKLGETIAVVSEKTERLEQGQDRLENRVNELAYSRWR